MSLELVDKCPICSSSTFRTPIECKDETTTKEIFQIVTCASCTLKITNPRPDQQTIGKYYVSSNYISHNSDSRSFIDKLYYLARKYSIKNKASLITKLASNRSLLDIGCGTGDFLAYMKNVGWTVTGTEPTQAARTIARDKNLTIFSELTEIQSNQFSIITMWHVLEHIHDLHSTLKQIQNLLSENGVLIIAVPNHLSNEAHHYRTHWAAFDVPRHLWHFNQTCMRDLLTKMDLKLIKTSPMKLDAYYISILSEQYSSPTSSRLLLFLKAIYHGLKSNIIARITGEYSSLIYIVTK